MNQPFDHTLTRRSFIKNTGRFAAVSALAGLALPNVHAAEDNTLQVVLIGCGGRGTGAAMNALSVNQGPVKLVAMADVFRDRLDSSYGALKGHPKAAQVDVPEDRKFIGFDAYQKAMDCLKPGDIVILTTPLAFRWVHFGYAIQKGLHVFMEKPLTADGPTSRRMLDLGKAASAKNLKVGVGLMSRHMRSMQELAARIQDGAIGNPILLRGYRMHGPGGSAFATKWPGQPTELLWQIRNFHSFIWASGGCFNDFYIHHVDHCCWMKNSWPVKAQALGARHYRNNPQGERCVDQNFDVYSVEYTFADGAKLIMDGRCINGCKQIYSSYAQGTKGNAIISSGGDCGAPSSLYLGRSPEPANLIWESQSHPGQDDPYQNEWNDLVDAIRNDRPYNEVERGVYASAVSSLGRMAAHTGQELTLEDFLKSDREYAPGVDQFKMDSPAPVLADANGIYPVPEPGIKVNAEY
ncbi:MAG TPA: Gfo/Idh/MocA family oxidoreductase [Dongiaceae bacterium]|jgi:predicted dehydrogenase|nr:Gfo/Idh/MocA family oxidoreductase [Dongiaceae bacterium]